MLPLVPDWDMDNMIRYYSDEHEGKSVRDGGKKMDCYAQNKICRQLLFNVIEGFMDDERRVRRSLLTF